MASMDSLSSIIWLASYPKSGNTWLRLFLANYFSEKRPLSLNQAAEFGIQDSALGLYRSVNNGDVPKSPAQCAGLRPIVQQKIASDSGKNICFVKTHNACIAVSGVPLITPEVTAGAILLVRNPLDVSVSFAHHNCMPHSRAVEALCSDNYYVPADRMFVDQHPTSWRRFYRSWTMAPGLSPLILRYEDMVMAPEESFGQVLSFLGLVIDKIRLKEALQATKFESLVTQEQSEGFVEGDPSGKILFFREGKIGSWKSVFSSEQVERIISFNLHEMVRFGYARKSGELTERITG